jgi:hypothetical protein
LDGKLLTGASPAAMVAMLEGMGADAIGINCSLGPAELEEIVKEYLQYASIPVIVKPNAGLPRVEGDRTVYDVSPSEFALEMRKIVDMGASVVGGCCGTTPEHIKELVRGCCDVEFSPIERKNLTLASSYARAVEFGKIPIIIGERINPTGKKRFKEALLSSDIDYILKEGVKEEENGDLSNGYVQIVDRDFKIVKTMKYDEMQPSDILKIKWGEVNTSTCFSGDKDHIISPGGVFSINSYYSTKTYNSITGFDNFHRDKANSYARINHISLDGKKYKGVMDRSGEIVLMICDEE